MYENVGKNQARREQKIKTASQINNMMDKIYVILAVKKITYDNNFTFWHKNDFMSLQFTDFGLSANFMYIRAEFRLQNEFRRKNYAS